MDLSGVNAVLAMGPPPSGQSQPPMWTNLVFLGLMFVVLYLILLRPQQKKAREHAEMLKTVRAGDKVVTSGGVVGIVVSVKEKTLSIRSADAKMEVTKSAIAEITERSGETGGS
jgi:preprotein translocase subunit YajC